MVDITPRWRLLDLEDNPEYDLYESHVCELVDISGFPINYYIKTSTTSANTVDDIYGEDPNKTYTDPFETQIIYEPSEENSNIFGVFGFEPEETIQYCYIPKNNFIRDISDFYNESYKPMIGDVIVTLWNNKRYEIVNISDTQNIFQGKKFIWEFVLQPYKHSEESDKIIDYTPFDDDFPDINETGIETKPLSGYGDNDTISEESDNISIDTDSDIYGY